VSKKSWGKIDGGRRRIEGREGLTTQDIESGQTSGSNSREGDLNREKGEDSRGIPRKGRACKARGRIKREREELKELKGGPTRRFKPGKKKDVTKEVQGEPNTLHGESTSGGKKV